MIDDPDRFCARLVAEMPDAVIAADAAGLIRFWNPGATRIFGYAAAEALGKSLDIIIPAGPRARHWEGYRHTMATGVTRYGADDLLSVPALRRDGRRISVAFTIVPLRAADGTMAGIAAVLRDVTAAFEETRALRREVAALRAGAGH
jgi:PAS domain S-box-containing protein